MCKDYYWVPVQVERNYKLIQNQTINRQEQTQAERCVLENQLDDRRLGILYQSMPPNLR